MKGFNDLQLLQASEVGYSGDTIWEVKQVVVVVGMPAREAS